MNCSEAEHFFDAYLDGELAGSLRLEFDAHRLRCTVCQQKLAMMEACEHILARDTRGPALSEGFTDRVMSEIDQQRIIARRVRKRRLIIGTTVAFQAAAIITFAVLWIGYWSKPAPPVPNDPAFVAEVKDAMEGGDRVVLSDLVFARRDEYLAARSNLEDEVHGLARLASTLSILDGLSIQPDTTPSPWSIFPQVPTPASSEETEPEPDAAGSYSL
jgi:hypothetical protein